ncbi:MAG: zinc-ribbon domain containing protein [Candidatus Riflebacteria bacterium]|nr:zinc-ribbon domain containing protein [Candidatus Riflebacteria bacterium]
MDDKTINCRNCGQPFTFTVAEQQFYQEKGFEHEPVRCKGCRDQRKSTRGGGGGGGGSGSGPRQMHNVTCSDCGQETQVPFKPTGEKPVYCRECFNKHRGDSRF